MRDKGDYEDDDKEEDSVNSNDEVYDFGEVKVKEEEESSDEEEVMAPSPVR